MDRRRMLVWIAVGVLIVGGLALAMVPRGAAGVLPASKNVSNSELRDLVASGTKLVDVRTAGEFAAGHIEGALNVPVDGIQAAAAAWDKAAPVAVYCETGARSLNASSYLSAQGFTHVYNLTNGFASWDGGSVAGAAPAPGAAPATGKPTMYEFASDT